MYFIYYRETPVVDSKVTEKVVEEVEDSPVVASGEETETVAPVEEVKAPAAKEEEETPAVESSGVVEATENGNGEAEVVEPVEEAGKLKRIIEKLQLLISFFIADESVKRKVDHEEAPEVPEKRAKTDDVEAVEPKDEEVVA